MSALHNKLIEGTGDAVAWPTDAAFSTAWLGRPSYNDLPSQRLQYIFKCIEQAKCHAKNEKIEITSMLTVEHIMPVSWWTHWPLSEGRFAKNSLDRLMDPVVDEPAAARDRAIHTMGNLTLLTGPMNSSLQNVSYAEKRPEILRHSALALNREFHDEPDWNEARIDQRGRDLLFHALNIWPRVAPDMLVENIADCAESVRATKLPNDANADGAIQTSPSQPPEPATTRTATTVTAAAEIWRSSRGDVLPVSARLQAEYLNKPFHATVEKNGIRFNGELYSTPSAAGVAVKEQLGRKGRAASTNGRDFWKIQDPISGQWVPIATLHPSHHIDSDALLAELQSRS